MLKVNKRKIVLIIILAIVIFLAVGFLMAWKLFVVKKVIVKGNEIYSDEQIENWILDEEYSWSTLYVVLENKFHKSGEIPFVENLKITMKGPRTIEVSVTEKGMLGYIFVPSLGQNAYFDKDGFVTEISNDILDDVTKICGVEVENATLYQKLELENTSIFKSLLSISQLLKKYEKVPELIYILDGEMILCYGDIQVNMGSGDNLNEKIVRFNQIYPELDGQTGTLHMEKWSSENTDVYFKINELVTIPNDVQSLPTAEPEASDSDAQVTDAQVTDAEESEPEDGTAEETSVDTDAVDSEDGADEDDGTEAENQ